MSASESTSERKNFCPVYDLECPGGSDAAASCDARFARDYNPLTSLRDAEIEHCAIYRMEQAAQQEASETDSGTKAGKE